MVAATLDVDPFPFFVPMIRCFLLGVAFGGLFEAFSVLSQVWSNWESLVLQPLKVILVRYARAELACMLMLEHLLGPFECSICAASADILYNTDGRSFNTHCECLEDHGRVLSSVC